MSQVADRFITAARETLAEGMRKIEHCVGQLSDEQVWWRPQLTTGGDARMNSIANLMLHLAGNVRQWIVSGVGGAKDIRNRPLEFSDDSHRPKANVLSKLKTTVDEALVVLGKLNESQLVAERRIQGFETNVRRRYSARFRIFAGTRKRLFT